MSLFALLLAVLPAQASLAVALIRSDYVLLASDSRTWDIERDRRHSITRPKIDAREGYGIAVTNYGAPLEIWRLVRIRPGESAEGLARRIVAGTPAPSRVLESRVVVVRYAPIDAVVLDAEFHPDGRKDVTVLSHPPAPSALAIGWPWKGSDKDIPAWLAKARVTLEGQPTMPELVTLAQGFLDFAASRTSKIGGDTHFILANREGIQSWVAPADPAPVLMYSGIGFWLDASVNPPTFRVGDPNGNRVSWDGANLTIGQGNITIDSSGIHIVPTTTWTGSRAYGFTVPTGEMGLSGIESGGAGVGRSLWLRSKWTGAGNLSDGVRVFMEAAHTPSSGGTSRSAWIDVSADSGGGDILLQATGGQITLNSVSIVTDATIGVLSTPELRFVSEVDFSGISSDGAGRIACVKSDGNLGTCSGGAGVGGTCTCG